MRRFLLSSPLFALVLASPAAAQTAEFPFFDGFEGGVLEPHWIISKPWGDGKATVTSGNGPYSGSYHMILDGPAASLDSNVTADLRIDLEGESSVLLEFAVRDYGDEYSTSSGSWLCAGSAYYDGVFVSDDNGVTWKEIFKLNDTHASGVYQKHTIDLDIAVADTRRPYLLENDGTGNFVEVAQSRGITNIPNVGWFRPTAFCPTSKKLACRNVLSR